MTTEFVDEATVTVRGGDGGAGCASFRRERFRPRGGPDGGDGGRGGSVVLVADPAVGTLAPFRHRRRFRAPGGGRGGSNHRTGADAPDLVLAVPVGTVVRDLASGEVVADLARPGTRYVAARGGRGGRGNASLEGPLQRAPGFAERGEPGEERRLRLELRLVADVGLLGPPNAGKSTLLRAVSAARPKVAPYPFTTLEPHLGVVEAGEERFVVADLPGLIEGAAEGRGLGARFLRHAERCAVLVAVVDLAGPDPAGELETLAREVRRYSPELAARLRVVAGNKVDLPQAAEAPARRWAEERGLAFAAISALRGDGVGELCALLAREVAAARASQPPPESFAVFRPVAEDKVVVEREGAGWRVRSRRAERLVAMLPVDHPQAARLAARRLRALGVDRALEAAGAREGDEVYIGERTFEFHPEPGGSG